MDDKNVSNRFCNTERDNGKMFSKIILEWVYCEKSGKFYKIFQHHAIFECKCDGYMKNAVLNAIYKLQQKSEIWKQYFTANFVWIYYENLCRRRVTKYFSFAQLNFIWIYEKCSGELKIYKLQEMSLLVLCHAFPDSRNPNLEYEIINPRAPQLNNKTVSAPITTTQRSVFINTPTPPPKDSKNFVYDPSTKTWTQVKKNDPPPAEDALIWNQSNDKWLTMAARV